MTSNTSIAAADITTNVTASGTTATPEPTAEVTAQEAAASAATPPVTSTPKEGAGFEAVFAIASLLAVAVFALRKRE